MIGGKFGQAEPLVIIGALAVGAGLLSLLLPETLNRKLPDTLAEGEQFIRLVLRYIS
jgi:OCT family organic cation transporter-like MFS transporter 4/5